MKSILQVFIFNFSSKILMGVIGLILIRYMAQTEYASYTLAQSFYMMATGVLAVAFNKIYIVGFKKFNFEQTAHSFLGIQFVLLGVFALLGLPLSKFTNGLYGLIVVLMFASCSFEFTKTFFQQGLQFFKFSMIEIVRTLLFFSAILLLIYFTSTAVKAWQVLAFQSIAMFVVFFFIFRHWFDLKKIFHISAIVTLGKNILKGEYRYLFGYFVVLALFSQMDVFMLKARSTEIQLATYGSAFRYYSLLILALNAIISVFLPVLQKIDTRTEIDQFFAKQKKMIFIITPIILLGAWCSEWIIPWIDAGKYPLAVNTFRILAISSIISIALSPHAALVIRFENFKFLFLLSCLILPMAFITNAVLVFYFGAIGAAISNLITYGTMNTIIYLQANKLKNKFSL